MKVGKLLLLRFFSEPCVRFPKEKFYENSRVVFGCCQCCLKCTFFVHTTFISLLTLFLDRKKKSMIKLYEKKFSNWKSTLLENHQKLSRKHIFVIDFFWTSFFRENSNYEFCHFSTTHCMKITQIVSFDLLGIFY